MILGQVPSLAWAELADTAYWIGDAQDTLAMAIQSRSGNVRRFDGYDTTGGRLFLAAYDSVYLDSSGRVQRIRRYRRRDPNASFSLLADMQFSYPVSPSLWSHSGGGLSCSLSDRTIWG